MREDVKRIIWKATLRKQYEVFIASDGTICWTCRNGGVVAKVWRKTINKWRSIRIKRCIARSWWPADNLNCSTCFVLSVWTNSEDREIWKVSRSEWKWEIVKITWWRIASDEDDRDDSSWTEKTKTTDRVRSITIEVCGESGNVSDRLILLFGCITWNHQLLQLTSIYRYITAWKTIYGTVFNILYRNYRRIKV